MCTRPIEAWQSDEFDNGFKKKIVFKAHSSEPWTEGRFHFNNKVCIPCGKCIECRLKKTYQWSDRIMLEAEQYNVNSFITLTYDDNNLPYITLNNGDIVPTLRHSDVQKFLKRLRKSCEPAKLRFFMCGEYGETTRRPHYHIIIFNYFPDDCIRLYSDNGNTAYTSPKLERIWSYGQVVIGQLNPTTARYVSGYLLKKQFENSKNYVNKPPYISMSKRPGLAHNYYINNRDKLKQGALIYPPMSSPSRSLDYFDRLIEKENPEVLYQLKTERSDSNTLIYGNDKPVFDKEHEYIERERRAKKKNKTYERIR